MDRSEAKIFLNTILVRDCKPEDFTSAQLALGTLASTSTLPDFTPRLLELQAKLADLQHELMMLRLYAGVQKSSCNCELMRRVAGLT